MDDIIERLRAKAAPHTPGLAGYDLPTEAAAEITRLRAALDARDAEIAAWLRAETLVNVPIESEWVVEGLATAIEAGQYRKENGDGLQSD